MRSFSLISFMSPFCDDFLILMSLLGDRYRIITINLYDCFLCDYNFVFSLIRYFNHTNSHTFAHPKYLNDHTKTLYSKTYF